MTVSSKHECSVTRLLLSARLRWYLVYTGRLMVRHWQWFALTMIIVPPPVLLFIISYPFVTLLTPETSTVLRLVNLLGLAALVALWVLLVFGYSVLRRRWYLSIVVFAAILLLSVALSTSANASGFAMLILVISVTTASVFTERFAAHRVVGKHWLHVDEKIVSSLQTSSWITLALPWKVLRENGLALLAEHLVKLGVNSIVLFASHNTDLIAQTHAVVIDMNKLLQPHLTETQS